MAPIRQICHRQLELLVEFAEANKSVVLSNLGKGPLGQQEANKAWEELAPRLNSIGGGVTKTPANWKRYWHVLKCRTKAKAADIRRSHVGTGGGPNKTIPLSDLEQRIISIIGKVAVEGIPEIRVPFDLTVEPQPSCSSSNPPQSTAPAPSNEMELEFVVEEEQLEYPEPEISLPDPASALLSSATAVEYAAAEVPENSREAYAASSSTQARASRRIFRPRRNRDDNLPRWAYELEEKRIAVEERIADEIAGLGATNKEILGCLQQLVQLLQGHIKNNNNNVE